MSVTAYGSNLERALDTVPPAKSITVVQRAPQSAAKPLANIPVNTEQRYVGFNTSYLLQQLMPFNAIPVQQNMYGVTYRKYKQNKGYRISMGANLTETSEVQWLGLRFDRERRKEINNHWRYFYGMGGGLEVFENPDQVNFFTQTEVNVLGQLHWGIEYRINPVMSLSMECQGILLLGSSSALVLRPPTVITAFFNIN
ncbi:MAG: hypothetical protein ACKOXR_02835 [Bacteroidota bacterium]